MSKLNNKIDKEIWEKSANYTPDFEPNVDAGLRRLKDKIAREKTNAEPARLVPMFPVFLKAAAAVAVFAIAAFAINLFTPQGANWVQIAATESIEQINLPDGSSVWLDKNAQLSYVENFEGTERQLKLEGKAFFDVKRNPEKPFIIQAGEGNVRVLGTSFSIDTQNEQTSVFVKSGKVAFKAKDDLEPVLLTKNMKADYTDEAQQIKVIENASPNEIAWQSGVLVFRGTPLEQIIKDVEKAYGISIVLQNKSLAHCQYTDRIETHIKSPTEALSGILKVTELQMTEDEGKYSLTGGKSTCK